MTTILEINWWPYASWGVHTSVYNNLLMIDLGRLSIDIRIKP